MLRRIVLLHTDGATKGMRQILGTDCEFKEAGLPEWVEGVQIDGRTSRAVRVATKKRYVLYREEPSGTINASVPSTI